MTYKEALPLIYSAKKHERFEIMENMLRSSVISRSVYLQLAYRFIEVDFCAGSDDCTSYEGAL